MNSVNLQASSLLWTPKKTGQIWGQAGGGWVGAAVAIRIWQWRGVVFKNLDVGQEVLGSVVTMVLP